MGPSEPLTCGMMLSSGRQYQNRVNCLVVWEGKHNEIGVRIRVVSPGEEKMEGTDLQLPKRTAGTVGGLKMTLY